MVRKSFNRIQVMYEELQTVGDPDLFKSSSNSDNNGGSGSNDNNNSPVS